MFLMDEVEKNGDTLWFKYHGDEETRKKDSMTRVIDVRGIRVMEKSDKIAGLHRKNVQMMNVECL